MSFDLSKLGVKLNIPKVNFMEYTGVFEAPEKFGKTAFSTLYPKSILLAPEAGYKAQVINHRDITKWEDFRDFIDSLEEHREEIGDNIQTIIIDTVDKLYPMAAPYVVKQQSIRDGKRYNEIKDIPFGQGWNYHDREFEKQFKRIQNLGFTILYLTHSMVRKVTPKVGEPYDVYKSTMPDRCAEIIYPECDYIIHGERRIVDVGGEKVAKRALVVKGNDEIVSGNRVYFDEDIIFDTEEEAMEKFQEKFQKRISEILQKAGITTNIEELSVQQEQERKEKVSKYVETINELTAEEAISEIDLLVGGMDMNSSLRDTLGDIFQEEMGIKNYKLCTDAKQLQMCIKRIKELKRA